MSSEIKGYESGGQTSGSTSGGAYDTPAYTKAEGHPDSPPAVSRNLMYDYLLKKPDMTRNKALGMVANIERESAYKPGNWNKGGNATGLFQ